MQCVGDEGTPGGLVLSSALGGPGHRGLDRLPLGLPSAECRLVGMRISSLAAFQVFLVLLTNPFKTQRIGVHSRAALCVPAPAAAGGAAGETRPGGQAVRPGGWPLLNLLSPGAAPLSLQLDLPCSEAAH